MRAKSGFAKKKGLPSALGRSVFTLGGFIQAAASTLQTHANMCAFWTQQDGRRHSECRLALQQK